MRKRPQQQRSREMVRALIDATAQVIQQQGFLQIRITCPTCGGRGQNVSPEDRCEECKGSGRQRQSEKLTVTVPAGVDTGMQLRLVGKGDLLMLGPSSSSPHRVQGCWVEEAEVRSIVKHWIDQAPDFTDDQSVGDATAATVPAGAPLPGAGGVTNKPPSLDITAAPPAAAGGALARSRGISEENLLIP